MTAHNDRLLTADDIADNAKQLRRPLDRRQRKAIAQLLGEMHDAYVVADPVAGAIDLAARMLVGLLARRIDPDVSLRVVNAQLRLLGLPPHDQRALNRAYTEMVNTGLDFSLSEEEMVRRALPLIAHAVAGC